MTREELRESDLYVEALPGQLVNVPSDEAVCGDFRAHKTAIYSGFIQNAPIRRMSALELPDEPL